MKNAKTMFKVMSEFKKIDTKQNKDEKIKQSKTENSQTLNYGGPTFFA